MAIGTLNALYDRIVLELGDRTDLIDRTSTPATGPIPDAVTDAIKAYQKERFRFNENAPLTPFLLNTVPHQYIYTVADDPRIPLLMRIDYVNYLLGSTNNRMGRDVPEAVYLATINGTYSGPPGFFAYDANQLVIYPAPDIVYPLTIGGYLAVAAPDPLLPDAPGNVWMNDAERLIRSRAKYEIARHKTRNAKMAAEMSPFAEAPGEAYFAFSELKGEANRIKATGRVRAMKF